jgi:small subunit ribosomal protein S5
MAEPIIEAPIEAVEQYRRKSREEMAEEAMERALDEWKPKTALGKKVREGKIKNIDEVLSLNQPILEAQIVDLLMPSSSDLLLIGQSKGKFGGGKRRAWKQTQRKTMEGNVPTFSCGVIVGDKEGHVGVGFGRAKETLPAREKAVRNSKLNVTKITRGCGSFDCLCEEKHSVPFIVEGKCGSTVVRLYPAPQGTGLVIGGECKKILKLAGIKDVYGKTFGQTRTTINLAQACIEALKKTNRQIKK